MVLDSKHESSKDGMDDRPHPRLGSSPRRDRENHEMGHGGRMDGTVCNPFECLGSQAFVQHAKDNYGPKDPPSAAMFHAIVLHGGSLGIG